MVIFVGITLMSVCDGGIRENYDELRVLYTTPLTTYNCTFFCNNHSILFKWEHESYKYVHISCLFISLTVYHKNCTSENLTASFVTTEPHIVSAEINLSSDEEYTKKTTLSCREKYSRILSVLFSTGTLGPRHRIDWFIS